MPAKNPRVNFEWSVPLIQTKIAFQLKVGHQRCVLSLRSPQ